MGEPKETVSLEKISFPGVPQENLEDADVLRLLISAHRGLAEVYEHLANVVVGQGEFVVRVFRSDWRRRTGALLEAARGLLRDLEDEDAPQEEVASRPTAADARKLASQLKGLGLAALLSSLEEIAGRCAVCIRLVPLGSASPEVRNIFRHCVDAEDLHLAQLEWFRENLEGQEFV